MKAQAQTQLGEKAAFVGVKSPKGVSTPQGFL